MLSREEEYTITSLVNYNTHHTSEDKLSSSRSDSMVWSTNLQWRPRPPMWCGRAFRSRPESFSHASSDWPGSTFSSIHYPCIYACPSNHKSEVFLLNQLWTSAFSLFYELSSLPSSLFFLSSFVIAFSPFIQNLSRVVHPSWLRNFDQNDLHTQKYFQTFVIKFWIFSMHKYLFRYLVNMHSTRIIKIVFSYNCIYSLVFYFSHLAFSLNTIKHTLLYKPNITWSINSSF